MIVVDTNVIAYFLIEGERTPLARRLWRHEPRWRVPVLWRHEFLNVLASYARTGGIAPPAAKRLWQTASRFCAPMEVEVDLGTALQLALDQDISAYDAWYLTLADTLDVPLVSEDRRLRKRCRGMATSMEEFLAA